MIAQPFEYHAPKTLAEASQLVARFGDEGKILAGGHSLVPMMKLRLAAPKHLIDLGGVTELSYIREEGEKIQIGALTTHYKIESSDLLKSKCPLLPETAIEIGDAQVRNKGTIGGSLAHSDPSGDWPAAALALDAEIQALGAGTERWIPVKDFFVGMLETSLAPGEILTAIRVSSLPAQTGDAYVKLRQPASGFAVVGVAVRLGLDAKGGVQRVSVGITGAGPKAYRAAAVEDALHGKSPSPKRLAEASTHAADGIDVNADLYASSAYRAHLASVYTRRALEKALERAGGK
jgi:carbon-monoxide dehydrogenase medium subunit